MGSYLILIVILYDPNYDIILYTFLWRFRPDSHCAINPLTEEEVLVLMVVRQMLDLFNAVLQ